jgi:predicted nucleotidyltransferase
METILRGRYMRGQNLIKRNKILGRHYKDKLRDKIIKAISLGRIHQIVNDNERNWQSKK